MASDFPSDFGSVLVSALGSVLAPSEAGASDFSALLPMAPALTGASGFNSFALGSPGLLPAVPGGMALLPVAAGFKGALPSNDALPETGAEDAEEGPEGGLPGPEVGPDAEGMALLPVGPGFASESVLACGVASCGRPAVPGAFPPGRALLPVGPGFTGSDLTGSGLLASGLAADGDGPDGVPLAFGSDVPDCALLRSLD